MARLSEDVVVRCRTCAKIMAEVTVRSENQSDLDKIAWVNKETIRCQRCAASNGKKE